MKRTSRSQDAFQETLVMIGNGSLGPDDLLQETPLGKLLSMSRTPVREAMRRVEAIGLAYRKGRFLRVHGPGTGEIGEIFVLLNLLEPVCARGAAETIHGQDLSTSLLARPDMSEDSNSVSVRTNIAVSRFLAEACSNSAIGQQVFELRCLLLPVGSVMRDRAARIALADMLSAIASGNNEKAAQACRDRLAIQAAELLGFDPTDPPPDGIRGEEGGQV